MGGGTGTGGTPLAPIDPVHIGKVADSYEFGGKYRLVVRSDRLSAFDVVMAEPIPDRGKVLTGLTEFWLSKLLQHIPNHYVTTDMIGGLPTAMRGIRDRDGNPVTDLDGRGMVVELCEMLKVECIVRGYLEGSGLKEYQKTGAITGIPLPEGLVRASRLPEPIFTPSTKAETGHDENIDFDRAVAIVEEQFPGSGRELMELARELSLDAYNRAHEYALERGVIIADTKFEFGLKWGSRQLVLADEVLTPDSSRFWPLDSWEPGTAPQSYDKQIVRDYLQGLVDQGLWDKKPPAPPLPAEIIERTRRRYIEVYEILTGQVWAA